MNSWQEEIDDKVVLFHPYIPETAAAEVTKTLSTRWIGQGPKVEEFELMFSDLFGLEAKNCVSVNSGTAALHLAYILAGIGPGDEVLCPLFTCTATNIPLLYLGARPIFVDVDPNTLNINLQDLKRKISPNTKAIVTVDFGGLPCNYDELTEVANKFGIPIIQDAAHSLGGKYKGRYVGSLADFTAFSFQAIKHVTTGDGGMLVIKDPELASKARRLRWFGINRLGGKAGVWENDITEVGFKCHLNDVAATLGIEGLRNFEKLRSHRSRLSKMYFQSLSGVNGLKNIGEDDLNHVEHAAWIHTIRVRDREALATKLRENRIESGQVHYRNDRYSIFADSIGKFPGMDSIESEYLVLPLHMKVREEDVERICNVIKSGW